MEWSCPPLGGVLLAAGGVVHFFQARSNPPEPIVAALFLAGAVFLVLSLPEVYAVHAEATAGLGLSAHVLLQTGVLFFVLVSAPPLVYPGLTEPTAGGVAPFMLAIAFMLGLPLTAIAIRRGGVFPKGAGNVLMVATAFFFFSFFIAELLPPLADRVSALSLGILLAVGFGWIGMSLWNRR